MDGAGWVMNKSRQRFQMANTAGFSWDWFMAFIISATSIRRGSDKDGLRLNKCYFYGRTAVVLGVA